MMIDKIRAVVGAFAGVEVDGLGEEADLYRAGMTSHASVQVMLGLEEAFDVEFAEDMLTPETFGSIAAIARAIETLLAGAEA